MSTNSPASRAGTSTSAAPGDVSIGVATGGAVGASSASGTNGKVRCRMIGTRCRLGGEDVQRVTVLEHLQGAERVAEAGRDRVQKPTVGIEQANRSVIEAGDEECLEGFDGFDPWLTSVVKRSPTSSRRLPSVPTTAEFHPTHPWLAGPVRRRQRSAVDIAEETAALAAGPDAGSSTTEPSLLVTSRSGRARCQSRALPRQSAAADGQPLIGSRAPAALAGLRWPMSTETSLEPWLATSKSGTPSRLMSAVVSATGSKPTAWLASNWKRPGPVPR